MSYVSTLRQWDEAMVCVETKDIVSALRILLEIEEKTSKINYNIGCLYLNKNELDAAEKAFDASIGKDQHLAVAFFQRGITFFKKERKLIYEVLHNIGLVYAQMGKWENAQENLLSALNLRTESKLSHIDKALESILKQKLFPLVVIRPELMFKPNKHYVAELEKKDYLGKAKVISSVVAADTFSGFAPLQPQRGLVPYNFLEPLDITVATKMVQTKAAVDSSKCIVKVHFLFTISVCIAPGQPYDTVLKIISTKLKQPASTLTLSFSDTGGADARILPPCFRIRPPKPHPTFHAAISDTFLTTATGTFRTLNFEPWPGFEPATSQPRGKALPIEPQDLLQEPDF
ncbi:neutrophil cytosol factor 2 [Silurus asotus]|uniref:Neutrophil cytosol factor 2 n=1 Tax=Silurus asotus TaxID=30991 RepID=A0AAD5FU49_SILAS|nr:neutrophil cytosol factor 2 [Silurus asotus]